jgi:hypothetical protein
MYRGAGAIAVVNNDRETLQEGAIDQRGEAFMLGSRAAEPTRNRWMKHAAVELMCRIFLKTNPKPFLDVEIKEIRS